MAVRIDGRQIRFPSSAELVRRLVLGAPTMLSALGSANTDTHQRLVDEITTTMDSYVDDIGLAVPMTTHVLLAR